MIRVVLQTNPPASGVIAMMQRAEEARFLLRLDLGLARAVAGTVVIYSRILSATSAMTSGRW